MNMRDLLKLFEQAATPAQKTGTGASGSFNAVASDPIKLTRPVKPTVKPATKFNPMAGTDASQRAAAMGGGTAPAASGGMQNAAATMKAAQGGASPAAAQAAGIAAANAPATQTAARPDVEAGKAGIAAGGVAPPTPTSTAAGALANLDKQAAAASPTTAPAPAAAAPAPSSTSTGFAKNVTTTAPEPTQAAMPSKAPASQGGYAQSATGAEGSTSTIPTANPTGTGTTVKAGGGDLMSASGPVQSGANIKKDQFGTPQFEEELEEELIEELEEELAEMMRLSGLALNEKAPPGAKAERMVKHIKKGYAKDGKLSPKEKSIAYATAWKAHNKGKLDEGLNLMLDEEGHTLSHIVNRYKHEVKRFLQGDFMPENLYDALVDYYDDIGEIPRGILKGREGDPYQWVQDRFYDDIIADLGNDMNETMQQPVMDDTLNELAHLAGLSESRVDECGDMGMDQRDTFNVSTNMSSDGTKSVNISAQGDKAEELLSMLKLAGMGGSDRPGVMVVDRDEEMMDEERKTEYANTPEEEYETVDTIIRQGNDLNREKRQYADKPKLGDNPMAEEVSLEEQFEQLYNSVLVREADPKRPKGDTGVADIFTADKGIAPPSPDEGPVGKVPAPKQPAAPKQPVKAPGAR